MISRTSLRAALASLGFLAAACSGGSSSGPGPGGGCTSPSECPGTDTTCRARTCTAGVCGTSDAAAAAVCVEDGGQVCDGAGACVLVCDLSNPCTSPPAASCSGQVRTSYASPGMCIAAEGAPGYTCSYTPSELDCGAAGLVCEGGACVAPPPPPPSEQLQAIRDAATTCGYLCSMSRSVNGAIVTYLRPAIGYEGAGFYLQADQTGPALLVEVDPATLGTAGLAVGDRVSAVVTVAGVRDGAPIATGIASVSIQAHGVDVAPLVQDLSSAPDVVSAVASYADELVTIDGVLSTNAAASGYGFAEFRLTTAGYPSGDANLRLRVEAMLPDALDLVSGCTLRTGPVPLGRYNAQALPTARRAGELALTACPPPQVVSAVATGTTEVRIAFDRRIDPASVLGDGSQFAFSNGLVATAASVSGRDVTVTTSVQTPSQAYAATVADTVTDQLGSGLASGARTTSFVGYVVPAVLQLNEVAPHQNFSRDLVELLVVSGGRTGGGRLVEQGVTTKVLTTFPDVTVAAGDLVVVHFIPLSDPGGGDAPGSETTGKAQHPAASYPANYDDAWDFLDPGAGIASDLNPRSRVLRVEDRLGRAQDAVPFVDPSSQSTGFFAALQALQLAELWLPADCGGAPCTNLTTPRASAVSVNFTTVGNTPAADSVRRVSANDTNTNADWAVGAQSLGAPNP